MSVSLILQGIMTILSPFLQKAGEKAAEKIGEKFTEKTFEAGFWHKVKKVFIKDEEIKQFEIIESKEVATPEDIKLIENKLLNELKINSQFAAEIESAFNFSATNKFISQQLLISIKSCTEKLVEKYQDREGLVSNPIPLESVEYQIKQLERMLRKDESKFRELVNA